MHTPGERGDQLDRPAPTEELSVSLARQLLGAVAEAVVTIDLDGTVAFWNAAATDLYGWPAEEAIGRRIDDLIHPRFTGPDEDLPALIAKGSWSHELEVRHRDGWTFLVESANTPIRDATGEVVGIVGASTDVSASRVDATRMRWLSTIVECSEDAIVAADLDGTITFWNRGATLVYGWTAAEAVGAPVSLIVPDEQMQALRPIRAALDAGQPSAQIEADRRHRDGHLVPVALSVTPLRGPAGDVIGYTATARDMTAHRRAQETLAASEARFRALVQHSVDLAMIVDAEGRVRHIGESGADVGGYAPSALLGADGWSLVHDEDQPAARALFAEVLSTPGAHRSGELRVRRADGRWRWIEAVGTNLLHEPAVGGVVVNLRDITRRKLAEAELFRRANHDELTGLPNRSRLLDRIHELTAQERRPVALLLLDVDEFKLVNDTHGHGIGDELLRLVAERIRMAVRLDDMVARLGGDEFVVLCAGVLDAADAVAVAEQVQAAFDVPFDLAPGVQYFMNATIGIATGGPDAVATQLLADADTAMYAAKQRERGSHGVYDETLRLASAARLRVEAELRAAVDRGELRCHYQPVVDLSSGLPVAVEALARWYHPTRGVLAPSEWVPIAESSNLILAVGRRILEQACRDAATWMAAGRGVPVAVNLSARQLADDSLPEQVAGLLHEHALAPGLLSFEVTEHAVLADPVRAVAIIERMRDLGVRFALDDFGTGYSSLAYLKQLPVELVKIDRSFIQGVARDWNDRGIVQAVVQLGRMLGRTVVAEGVEHDDQWSVLRGIGCQLGQGFLWSPAVPAAELPDVFAQLDERAARHGRVSHS